MNESDRDVHTVAVLGFGTMGAGIAQVVAASGRASSCLRDRRRASRPGLARVGELPRRRRPPRQGHRGRPRRRSSTASPRTTSVADLAGVDLVIESVVEDLDVKVELAGPGRRRRSGRTRRS